MCLLIVLAQVRADAPLVVGANRDELLDRPAVPMAVLRASDPRIIGGRDELAGGTWLAVNEHGVVAGLTNRPTPDGPDPARRSRGELPLALAAHRSAEEAVDALAFTCEATDYNPAWLLVADRASVFFVDVAGDEPVVERLAPGVHVLENRTLLAASPKATYVRSLLDDVERDSLDGIERRLQLVLADHTVPPGQSAAAEAGREGVPDAVGAACVHAERYGTRWSGVVTVPASAPPVVRYAPGPPCAHAFVAADGFA